MASAIGPAVVANSRERGGQRESAGVVRAQAQPSHGPADCRCGGEGAARPFPLLDGDLRRRRRRPHAGLKPARASDRHPTGTRRQGRLGRSAAEIERGPLGGRAQARSQVRRGRRGSRRSRKTVTERGLGSKSASTPLAMLGFACGWLRAAKAVAQGRGFDPALAPSQGLTMIGRDDPPNHRRRQHQSDTRGVEDMSTCGHGTGRESESHRRRECARSRHCGNDHANALNARSA